MWKVSENDHSDLNFAVGCLYCDAISLSEFKKWVELVIETSDVDEIPYYMYDLLEFDKPLFHLSREIGFDLINDLSKEEEYSLYGIGFMRQHDIYESPIDKETAIIYTKRNIHILERFSKLFPFIYFEIPNACEFKEASKQKNKNEDK